MNKTSQDQLKEVAVVAKPQLQLSQAEYSRNLLRKHLSAEPCTVSVSGGTAGLCVRANRASLGKEERKEGYRDRRVSLSHSLYRARLKGGPQVA